MEDERARDDVDPGRITPEPPGPRVRHPAGSDPAHGRHHAVRVFRLGMRTLDRPRADAQAGRAGPWGGRPEPRPDGEAAPRVALVCHDPE